MEGIKFSAVASKAALCQVLVDDSRYHKIVLEIGFSNARDTCGIWVEQPKRDKWLFYFDEAIEAVVDEITNATDLGKEVVLFIEAPLSVYFECARPKARHWRRGSLSSGEGRNGWYYGAGAVVFTGAFTLLKRLQQRFSLASQSDTKIVVHLVEIFSSNKGNRFPYCDGCEARAIYESLKSAIKTQQIVESKDFTVWLPVSIGVGSELISSVVFNRLDGGNSLDCPVIVNMDWDSLIASRARYPKGECCI